MSDYHSNEYYFCTCFGVIAKKDIKIGTLILKEKPQIFDNGSQLEDEWLEKGIPDWIKSVMASYNQMRNIDQEEFLKLDKIQKHDWSSNKGYEKIHETLKKVIGQSYQSAEYDQAKVLSIAEIFLYNSWTGVESPWSEFELPCYVEIHASKFNNSRYPNSSVLIEDVDMGTGYAFVKAIRDIKAGEEITNAVRSYMFL